MADQKSEWVLMTHPKIKADPARVTRKAFDNVYKDKGWSVESDAPAPAATKKGA